MISTLLTFPCSLIRKRIYTVPLIPASFAIAGYFVFSVMYLIILSLEHSSLFLAFSHPGKTGISSTTVKKSGSSIVSSGGSSKISVSISASVSAISNSFSISSSSSTISIISCGCGGGGGGGGGGGCCCVIGIISSSRASISNSPKELVPFS